MADVTTKAVGDRFEIVAEDEVLHSVGSEAEATALVSWVKYQLTVGSSVDDILAATMSAARMGSPRTPHA